MKSLWLGTYCMNRDTGCCSNGNKYQCHLWTSRCSGPVPVQMVLFIIFYFRCYTVHVVELLNHYKNHCIYIYKILDIKTLKTLRHVSVLRPFSGSYIFPKNLDIKTLKTSRHVSVLRPSSGSYIFPNILHIKTLKTLRHVSVLRPFSGSYIFLKNLHIKTLKTLRHVSVLRPSSGSYNFLAKVTLEIVTY